MKTAAEVADTLWPRGTDAWTETVSALTTYAEERVNEAKGKSALAAAQYAKDFYEKARAEALEEAAKVADDFGWTLPLYEKRCCNEASDDSACSATKQVADAIRALGAKA